MKDIPLHSGVTLIGCTASRESSGDMFKLNLRDSSHVFRGGARTEDLSSLDVEGTQLSILIACYTASSSAMLVPDDAEALPTCAAAVAAVPTVYAQQKIIQFNRCMLEAPTRREQIFTQDGKRLFANCRLRDWSGAIDVDLVSCCAGVVRL